MMQRPQRRALFDYWPAAFVAAVLALFAVIVWRHTLAAPEAVATISANSATQPTSEAISSPFSPWTDQTHDASALLGGVRLVGVRMSPDATRSGAIFLVAESDVEQAFVVGDDIIPGARLSAVAADHVLVNVAGGQTYTLMLSGEMQAASDAPIPTAQSAVALVGHETPGARTWLANTLARPEESLGPSPGWRVRPPLSDAASEAGLSVGDLILTVNGAPPSAASVAERSMQLDMIQLAVMRPDGERVTVWYALD